jgi:hypothetical protein
MLAVAAGGWDRVEEKTEGKERRTKAWTALERGGRLRFTGMASFLQVAASEAAEGRDEMTRAAPSDNTRCTI